MNSECVNCLIRDTCSFDPTYTVDDPNSCYFKRTKEQNQYPATVCCEPCIHYNKEKNTCKSDICIIKTDEEFRKKLLEETKMSDVIKTNKNDYYIRQLTAIGEELIKNAESIAGSERGIQSIYISATLTPDDPLPKIDVAKTLIPECLLGLYNTTKDE